MTTVDFPILTVLIVLPLATAGLLLFLPNPASARRFALVASLAELLLSLILLGLFDFGSAKLQLIERAVWIPSLNVFYTVGVDGFSILFPPLTALLTSAVIAASWTQIQTQVRLYLALTFVLESATLGVFCALDLALFFLFWELTLIPIFFLVSLWGIGPQRRYAASKYTLFMLAGGVPLLFGIILLALNHAEQIGMSAPRGLSFDYLTLLHVPVSEEMRTAVFLLLFLGFAVKVPLFPFHTWLPTIAMEGPAGVSALITGLKLGLYGLMRFAIPLVPDAAGENIWILTVLGTVGLLYGALIALKQTNLRRLLAYSSISHAGFVVIGLATLNHQGVQGALFQLINFTVVSGGIFLLAGFLHHRLGSTELSNLGGLARSMPLLTAFFFLFGIAAMGVPGTNGFAAEHLIIIGAFKAHAGAGLAALFGVILGAAYFLGFFQRAFWGPLRLNPIRTASDLRPRESALAVILIALVFLGGLVPGIVTTASAPAVTAWVARIDAAGGPSPYAELPENLRITKVKSLSGG
ncbi:proton-translocating NADH-quinone oxidoreductase, chain M [Methylocaldum marinum]|uniref:NADH-quinone oxidoreductase subunit M n=1 Tax=Methylocaldum marinum TaxID=1432792 RepID=A0A250KPE5_9GAMM|nr:NADH-quinone oxidoreductase subunit M [Methylocaldum marinum]BBA33424.1 proton-translocating NADH-quinone oxidoreductase, chain M [Methylocaldum marinum]